MSLVEREAQIASQLRSDLLPYMELCGKEHNLFIRCANAVARQPLSHSASIMLMVTARILGDLRVCQWAAEHGYAVQAASIGATIHELAYSAAFIGDSDERAAEWLAHDNERKSYPESGHTSAIAAVLKGLGQPEYSDREYSVYRDLCQAKHGNPMLQRNYGTTEDPDGQLIEQIPYFSLDTVNLGRFSLLHSVRAVYALLTVLLPKHFLHLLDESILAEFRQIGSEIRRLAEKDGLAEEAPIDTHPSSVT
jgi:hypothetical protein